jgi:BirA family biotin operon repressor/biotin-[acetyl-CoA-carboxylase] ligase
MAEVKMEFDVIKKGTVTSTNALAKQQAKDLHHGTVIVADCQTQGRGRLGRSFYSPDETGLYMSILLKKDFGSDPTLVTTMTAVAVMKAIEKTTGKDAQVKWVNDILIEGKKVCGILTESVINTETKKLDFAVLGVGINLVKSKEAFPEELQNIAGTVFEKDLPYLKEKFVGAFLNEFYRIYLNLSDAKFMDDYRKKCFCLGKEVSVISGDKIRVGKALSIDENARLEVKFSDNTTEFINSGEISIKM